jgi:lipid-A-disaccharide synthase-like uncharacterized protein
MLARTEPVNTIDPAVALFLHLRCLRLEAKELRF